MNINLPKNGSLAGIRVPDSKLAREITELVRAAGFREVTTEPAAADQNDGEAFTLTARV